MILQIVLVIYYLVASSYGMILMKQFLNGTPLNLYLSTYLDYRFLLVAFLYFSSALTWFFLLSRFQVSYIYPIISGLGYLFIIFLSVFILKEKPDFYTLLGMTLILVGIILIIIKGKASMSI